MMRVIQSIKKNEYLFSIATKFLNIVLGMIQSILIARFLGASLRGNLSYIQSISSVGAIVITFGMHQAYPYFRKKYGKDAIFREYITITYIVFFLYFIISLASVTLLRNLSTDIKIAILLLPVIGYETVVMYVLLIEKPNNRNILHLITSFLELIFLSFLFFFAEANYLWMVAILFFVHLLNAILFTIQLHCRPIFSKRIFSLSKKIFKMGFFPMLALLMTTLNYRIDVFMLKQYKSVSLSQIGIYSLGISLSDKIVLIPDTLKGVLASKLAKGANENEVVRICRLCFFSSLGLCVAILIFGQVFIDFLYGKEYSRAYSIICITAFGTIIIGYFKLIAQFNIVNKRQIINVLILSIAIIVDIIGNILLIPLYGITGAAIATCAGNVICGIIFIEWFARKYRIKRTAMFFPQKEDIKYIKRIVGKNRRQ